MIDAYYFPDDSNHGIYFQNKIIKCLLFLILIDHDGASFLFVFICRLDRVMTETHASELIFKVALNSKFNAKDTNMSWIMRH